MSDRFRPWLNRLFSPSGFRGPVLTLLSGTAASLGLSLLLLPLLTRLYTPEAFGVADYFITIVSIIVTFSGFRYEDALMLPEDEQEAAGVFWLALLLVLSWAVVIGVLLLWRTDAAALLRIPEVAPWLWLVPPAMLVMRFAKAAELLLTRRKQFRLISATQVAGTTTMTGTRVVAGLPPLSAGAGGLIGGFLAAQVVTGTVYARHLLRRSGQVLRSGLRLPLMLRLARRYRHFPLYATPSAVLNTFVARMPTLLLPWFFDVTVVGLYGQTFRALYIPLNLLGGAISQVFFVRAAEAHRAGTLPALTETIHARLVMIGLFPTLALLLAGPDLFAFVFGEAWRASGHYVRYVGPWLFLMSVASPLTRLFDVLERQRADLATSLLLFTTQLTALILGGLSGDPLFALLLLGVAGALGRLLHVGLLLHLARVPLRAALRAYGRYLIFSLPFLLPIALAAAFASPWLTTVVAALAGAGYVGLTVWQDRLLSP